MEIKYGSLLKKSWSDLKNNIIVFLPLVFSLIFLLILGFIILAEIFIPILAFHITKETLKNNLVISIIIIGIVGIIDFILLLIVSSLVSGMSISLLSQAVRKKKATSIDMWLGVRKYTWLLFRVSLLKILTFLIPLLVLGLLTGLGFLINKNLGIGLAILFGGIYLLYFVALAIFFTFSFFFLTPILTNTNYNSATKLMKDSFMFTKNNLGHVVVTWAIILGISLAMNIAIRLVSIPGYLFASLFLIMLPFLLILWIVSIVVTKWLGLFLFNSFFNSKIKK